MRWQAAMGVFVVFASLTAAGAQQDQARDPEDTMTVLIQKVDRFRKKVIANNSGATKVEFVVPATAVVITREGEKKKFSDLKPGLRTKVTYTGARQKPAVTRIEIAGQ